jgi:hypothetical protein
MRLIQILILIIFPLLVSAQGHHGHERHSGVEDTVGHMPEMVHRFSLNLPMWMNGSGTGWNPQATPMYGYMHHLENWMLMFHGNLFLRYNNQDVFSAGTRGASKVDAPNWFMGMAQRRVGKKGLLSFSAMLSLDPLTVGGQGYPLLFQTGETWQGRPLIDYQHPHNLFSELSVGYSHVFHNNFDVFAYFGYPGEPALGPVVFMHRVSALNNPDSPLGHHWQDATHITFGVATVGFRWGRFKFDASNFTGREPSENRYGFDPPLFDSWAGRLSYSHGRNTVFQFSHGYLISPEATKPGEDVYRSTASIIHNFWLPQKNSYIATALYWGLNRSDHSEHSFGGEATLRLQQNNFYGRYEWIQKDADELGLPHHSPGGHHSLVMINALTLGYNRIVASFRKTNLSIGAQSSFFLADDTAAPVYGRLPVSVQVYTRIYPGLMN